MNRSVRASLAAALLVVASLAGSVQPAFAGCNVTVKFVNKEDTVSKVDLDQSKVKAKKIVWGPYTALGAGLLNVPANGTKSKSFTLALGCNFDRRYKFFLKNGANTKTVYKPSADGATRATNLTVNINF